MNVNSDLPLERAPLNAYAEVVDGLVLPASLAGHPALDYCNTRAGWGDPVPGEFLKTYDHLAVWAAAAGLLETDVAASVRRRAREHPAAARAALRSAVSYRDAIYATALDRGAGPDWDRVASEAEQAAAAAELELIGGRAAWRVPASVGLRAPLASVARAATDLLSTEPADAIHACPGEACGWLFLDRTGRRRWCTMSTCGNRAKARRFAERARASSRARRP
jgi:predicted RNA-binding Zn ribbon-like protein